jgi:hypothetical protein
VLSGEPHEVSGFEGGRSFVAGIVVLLILGLYMFELFFCLVIDLSKLSGERLGEWVGV